MKSKCVAYLAIGIMTLTVMAGCINLGGGTTNVTRFFVLSPVASADAQLLLSEEQGKVSLGVGPMTLPSILKRNQIISRISDHEVNVAQFERWAEPLKDNIGRVLSENLSVLTGVKQTLVFPWSRSAQPIYRFHVDIIRFDAMPNGSADLSARWAIQIGEGNKEAIKKRSDLSLPLDSADMVDMVNTMSRLLEGLSREMANELIVLHRAG